MKRFTALLAAAVAAFGLGTAGAQGKKTQISIGTGGKSEVGFTRADAAWDACNGLHRFKDKLR